MLCLVTDLDNRIVSANTHFEEWWFKTFLLEYGNGGFHFRNENQFLNGIGFLLFSRDESNEDDV